MTSKSNQTPKQTLGKTQTFDQKAKSLSKIHNTSEESNSNKLSLLTCPSSISIETKSYDYQDEINIFGQYLLATSQHKKQKLQQSMLSYYRQLNTRNSKIISFIVSNNSKYNTQNHQPSQKELCLYHFMGAWILSMGFKEHTNKKYVLSKIYNHTQNHSFSIKFYQNCYQNLKWPGLEQPQRLKFLFKLCRDGWDFFVLQIIRFAKTPGKQPKEFNPSMV